MSFGEKLKKLRKEKKLTQEQFGEIFNIVKSTVSQYESGKYYPDYELLKKIAVYFDVTTDYLLELTENIPNKCSSKFNKDEQHLLKLYRNLKPKDKEEVLKLAEKLAKKNNCTSQ